MASNKTIAVQVQFNGINEAVNSLDALNKELTRLKTEQGKSDPTSEQFKELTRSIAATTSAINDLKAEQKSANAAFEEQRFAAGSYAAIAAETKRLTDEIKTLSVGVNATQQEYDDLQARIVANNTALANMNAGLKAVKESQKQSIDAAANSVLELKNKLRDLRAEQQNTDSATERYTELGNAIAATTSDLKALEAEQKAVNAAFEESKLAAGSYAQLTAETKRLTLELKSMAVGVNATQEEYDATLAKIKENNAAITDMNREMRNSKSIAERFREGAVAAFKDVAVSIVAGVTALEGFNALKGIGELGLDLERGFAQVNTVAQLTEDQLASLQSQVLETARNSTADLEQVPGALFKILSATGDVEESQRILEASLKAAQVGFTDLSSAADAGSQIYGAVKGQVKDVNEVFDVLFRTQKEGVLTFADLAKEIPRIVPSANQAGFAFKEVSGALATVTKAGLDANQSATVLDAAFREIADPAKQKGFKAIGASIFDAAGQTRPLIEVITDLNKSFEGLNAEEKAAKLKQIGLGGEASKGISILTENLTTLGQVTDSVVNGSLGEFDRQLALAGNTSDDLKAATNNLKVTLIQNLQPAFETVGRGLVGIAQAAANVISFFLENKGVVLLLVSAYAALNAAQIQSFAVLVKQRALRLALFAIDKAELVLTTLRTAAVTAYGVAQQILAGRLTIAAAAQQLFNLVMAANPVGAVVAATTALAGVLLILANRTKEVTEAERKRAEVTAQINEAAKSANAEIGKETASLEILVKGIRDETKSKEEKKRITDTLLSQYGSYLSELDKEAVKAGNVEVAYRKIKAAIVDNIVIRQKEEAINKIFSEQIEQQRDAALRLGEGFGFTADQVLNMVSEFEQLPNSIKDAINAGDGLKALGSNAAAGFTEAQKTTVKFFADVEKNSLKLGDRVSASVEDVNRALKEGADPKKLGADVALKQIVAAEKAMADGLTDIEKKFGSLKGTIEGEDGFGGEAAADAALSVAELNKEVQRLQELQNLESTAEGYKAVGKQIDEVKRKIEAITGASDKSRAASTKAAKETEKAADAEKDAAEKRAANLIELRKKLTDTLIANEDDATAQLLAAEEERYAREQQLAIDNAFKIIGDAKATDEELKEASTLQNAILEQLEIEHYQKLNDITAEGLRKELEIQEKYNEDQAAQRRRVLELNLDTIDNELATEEKNFKRRKELIQQQTALRVRQSELEAMQALKDAKTDEERTAIMENAASERVRILKEQANQIEEERKKQGPLLARILGIDKEELDKFADVFKEFGAVLNEAIDQFFAARLAALDKLIESQQEKIDKASEAAQQQVERVASLEERLLTATGSRRERLIALIDKERQRERELFAEKIKQEKAKAAIEAQKIAIEQQQAKIRKAQAIAQAVANTAVGITRTIAEVPKADFGVSTAILIALYAALGAAQVALISNQKFAKGGLVDGPSHDNGGVTMAVPSQGRMVELEGNEYVVNKRATERNADVLAKINKEGHSTSFAIVPRQFANGGQITAPNFAAINNAAQQQNTAIATDRLDRMIELQEAFLRKRIYADPVQFRDAIDNVSIIERRGRF
jgi:TP901 family phage tail tape measure protein